jgi:hypothetical protein
MTKLGLFSQSTRQSHRQANVGQWISSVHTCVDDSSVLEQWRSVWRETSLWARSVLFNSAPKRGRLAVVYRKYKLSHNLPPSCSEKRNTFKLSAGKHKEKRLWKVIDVRGSKLIIRYSRLSIIRAWFNRFAAQPRQCTFKEKNLFSVSMTFV